MTTVSNLTTQEQTIEWHGTIDESNKLHFVWSLTGALLVFGVLARLRLIYSLYYSSPPFRGFSRANDSLLGLYQNLWTEAAWTIQIAALAWLVLTIFQHIHRPRFLDKFFTVFGWLFLHSFMFMTSFLYGSHLRALFDVQSGLTFDLWSEGVDAFGPEDIVRFLTFSDAFFLLLPILLFWAFWMLPSRWRQVRNRTLLVMLGLILILGLSPSSPQAKKLDVALKMTPVQHLLSDYIRMRNESGKPDILEVKTPKIPQKPTKRGTDNDKQKLPPWANRKPEHTVQLIDPIFMSQQAITKQVPKADPNTTYKSPLFPNIAQGKQPPQKRWNVLFYMLESVGTRYIFDKKRAGRMPMRFLKKIADNGWYFTNHWATANSSPRAIFSILSGLYPSPQLSMFEMRRNICAPSLYDFANPHYDTFFMTPGSLKWYFPIDFFRNNGPKHLYGARKFRRFRRYGSFPNEIDVTTELIKRIKSAKKPFLASYLSFIPHGPYDDYGPKYRILQNTRRDVNRYYNNLYTLDLQIKRLFRALHKAGLLHNTIVVFVGDHGQAFGQHRRNWGHSRKSYNENYHAPLMFYQPKLFKPQVIQRRTSHVDIVPTLLDAMNLPYEPLLFQGESLFQSKFRRKQLFFYGNESTLSMWDNKGLKMQYLSKRRRCWVYDLQQDPKEKRRQSCVPYIQQRTVLRRYLKLQQRLRRAYDLACQAKLPFFNLQHPYQKELVKKSK